MFNNVPDEFFVGKTENISAESGVGQPQNATCEKTATEDQKAEVEILNQKIERLTLFTESLWKLLREKNVLTDEEIKNAVREIDFIDSKSTVRTSPQMPRKCSNCGNTLLKNRTVCIYCGTETGLD